LVAIDNFYIVAREQGAENPSIPTWANSDINPVQLAARSGEVTKKEISNVPGVFQLLNFLSKPECDKLIQISEALGYLEDAAVSLPRKIRHNCNVTWVTDETTTDLLWERSKLFFSLENNPTKKIFPIGLNTRFRFYRYQTGDYFGQHTDGAWPGSRVMNKQLIANGYNDRISQLSCIVFLSDGYIGGRTEFYSQTEPSEKISVKTPLGAALCFPHGAHPQHCPHSSEIITAGVKYIIRTDVLFSSN
jgi:hypothetical protein